MQFPAGRPRSFNCFSICDLGFPTSFWEELLIIQAITSTKCVCQYSRERGQINNQQSASSWCATCVALLWEATSCFAMLLVYYQLLSCRWLKHTMRNDITRQLVAQQPEYVLHTVQEEIPNKKKILEKSHWHTLQEALFRQNCLQNVHEASKVTWKHKTRNKRWVDTLLFLKDSER